MGKNQEIEFGVLSAEPGIFLAGADCGGFEEIADPRETFGVWGESRKQLRDTFGLIKDRAGVTDRDVVHSCIKQKADDEGWTVVFKAHPAKIKKVVGRRVLRSKDGEHDYYRVAA